ncbi:hypothetical protein K435DRAFT_507917 [Dendrothele bispora CBS 962.96]|uniref:Uncharacterized protein n=1 Tax=Dendrothele bispora (strain CBS 962.96) TaxID=1314807 RepID=A0A4S8MTN1_DENBC|nr:hypothetical protein K435DRAFT_507917 [Dendrothele bispora CBS 962.96]
MPSDRVPPLAASRHAQLRVYAIHLSEEEVQTKPEYKSRRLIRPRDPENPGEDPETDPYPTLGIVYLLARKTQKVWPKTRHGMVTLRRSGGYHNIGCAVVLADNSSLEAREIPTPEQLEEIQKVLETDRKPRWYWLE